MARGGPQVRSLAPRHECPAISNALGNATTRYPGYDEESDIALQAQGSFGGHFQRLRMT